jgi:hypothetical protein
VTFLTHRGSSNTARLTQMVGFLGQAGKRRKHDFAGVDDAKRRFSILRSSERRDKRRPDAEPEDGTVTPDVAKAVADIKGGK